MHCLSFGDGHFVFSQENFLEVRGSCDILCPFLFITVFYVLYDMDLLYLSCKGLF